MGIIRPAYDSTAHLLVRGALTAVHITGVPSSMGHWGKHPSSEGRDLDPESWLTLWPLGLRELTVSPGKLPVPTRIGAQVTHP